MQVSRRTTVLGFCAAGACADAFAAPNAVREGYAAVTGGKVWWRVTGSGGRTPVLTLHGGPGAGHDYLTPLEALGDQRRMVFYDQLGCGLSDRPDDPSLYRIERFCDEIDQLRRALGLKTVILYGHSWGGWLALEYMARRGANARVEALVLASTSASVRQFTDGAHRLLAEMPGGVAQRLAALEAKGDMESPAHQALVDQFYDAHLVHFDGPPPPFASRSNQNVETSKTYPIMNGPNEFTVTGNLKGWDRSADLGRIHVPTLILTSSRDESTLDCAKTLQTGIRGARLVVIPGARHLAMVEKPEIYVAALREFLAPLA